MAYIYKFHFIFCTFDSCKKTLIGCQRLTTMTTFIILRFYYIRFSPNEIIEYGLNSNSEKLREKYGLVWKMNLHYPLSQFNDIISILRYEKKPLYLFLERDSLKGGISTTAELIAKEQKCD